MRFDPSFLDEIRARVSVSQVVSRRVKLKRQGREFVGLSPFKQEKTPSFTVNEEKGVFYCFGCQAGGDVFKFLMLYDGLTFPESIERLAERYGIHVEVSESKGSGRETRRWDYYQLNDKAADLFHALLLDHSRGALARAYLQKRGVDETEWRRFRLGFAPGGDALVSRFRVEGIELNDAAVLGLVVDAGQGRYRDRFFNRIMFPITEPGGKIAGFGGRVIGEGRPKYLNSPETPLFHKGSQVYGLRQARTSIRSNDRVVVVEGYLDVLALAQFGVTHVAATLGTALTADHLRLLGRYTRNVTALFDGDDAGRNVAARSFEVLEQAGLGVDVAFLPEGSDPDTFVRTHGKEAMERLLERAVPLVEFYLNWLRDNHGTSLAGKNRSAAEVGRVLAKVTDPNVRDLLAGRAAELLGVREESLRRQAGDSAAAEAAASARRGGDGRRRQSTAGGWSLGEDRAETALVTLMLRFPPVAEKLRPEPMDKLVSEKWREVIRRLLEGVESPGGVAVGALTEGLPPELASEISELVLRGQEIDEQERDRMTADCLFFLQRRYLRRLEQELRRAIRVAEETRDDEVKKERMRQWQEVVQKERRLERVRPSL